MISKLYHPLKRTC
jgi:hypothetical protein